MNLQKICIVLVNPEEERNIGASCRSMANNEIFDLRIVGKSEYYKVNEEKIYRLAIHAGGIWENAQFFDSITNATKDCTLVAGTTRRRGKYRKGKLLLPEEFVDLAKNVVNATCEGCTCEVCDGGKDVCGGKVAIVFGNERTGLTDSELEECTLGVAIPSSNSFASLNLSHAVQIMCYHFFRDEHNEQTGYTPLPLERIDKTVSCIVENLQKIGFFKIAGKNDMANFWRSILSRAAISESEAKYIEKIFSKASGLASKVNWH
ncbi:MAG: RNA methyltransferase [Treponema sp.]|nr:RNA methyltransferase [Treponema sp.]